MFTIPISKHIQGTGGDLKVSFMVLSHLLLRGTNCNFLYHSSVSLHKGIMNYYSDFFFFFFFLRTGFLYYVALAVLELKM